MANINRDYLVINDVKKSNISLDNGSITFYITDKNTQNIFVNLVINISDNKLIQKYANIENAEDYTLTMHIVKPDNTYEIIQGKLHDKANAIFEFDLPDYCCDKVGSYRCELLTKCYINDREEITTSNKITYKVKSSVLNDLDDIVEAPEYPLVIQLFDKLSDIEQYEEDRRANELARQLAEEQRQAKHDELVSDMTNSIQVMDNKVVEVEDRISAKEQAVDKLINDTKADIDEYKVAKDQEIDEYKTAKDTEINEAITAQDNKIDAAISNQNDRITLVENNDAVQDNRLNTVEAKNQQQDGRLDAIEAKNTQQDGRLDVVENTNIQQNTRLDAIVDKNIEQDSRLDAIEAIDVSQNNRLDAIEAKNQQQDDRLLDIEKVNNKQAVDIKCLYGASQTIDVTKEGNSIYLQNSNNGFTIVDEIKGNTLVNCNKEPDKELILNGNINTSGDNAVTITEGVDGGLVDVALEGNTLVNVSKTKNSTAISKAYTVENSGNHIALEGDTDGSCRPVITGNTLVNILQKREPIDLTKTTSTGPIPLVIPNKLNTEYTIIMNLSNLNLDNQSDIGLAIRGYLLNGTYASTSLDSSRIKDNVIKLKWIETEKQFKNILIGISNSINVNNPTFTLKNIMILEGDYTDKEIPDYFEGLQSTFEDNLVTQEMVDSGEEVADNLGKYKVEYKTTSKNKFDANDLLLHQNNNGMTVSIENNKLYIEGTATGIYDFRPVSPVYNKILFDLIDKAPVGTSFTLSNSIGGMNYWRVVRDGRTQYVADTITKQQGDTNIDAFVRILKDTSISKREFNVQVEEGDTATEYEPYKEYIKTLYLNSTLLEGDTIEEKDGGIYHVHRSELVPYTEGDETSLITDKVNTLHELASPQYELIEQSNLAIPSYTNGHLDFNTAVPAEKVEFKPFTEELTYLYANTQYTVQFISTRAILADFTLGGALLLSQSIVKGLNRISITTSATLTDNKLTINGNDTGANIMEVIVTDVDRELIYFEGMKSVGEGKELQVISINSDKHLANTQALNHEPLRAVGDAKDRYVLIDGKWYIERKCGIRAYQEGDEDNHKTDLVNTVYPLEMPTYEEIDYTPLEVYSGTTRITTNSVIPTNITVKNHGFNCLLKPSTTYTVSSNLGLNTVTTPSTLTEDCLRFMDTDTSDVTTMKDVLILEGDWTSKADLIPANFSGIESAFEQELVTDEADEHFGKYKVNAKVVGKNLFNKDNIIIGKYHNCNIPTQNFKITNHSSYSISELIPIRPNTTYITQGIASPYHVYYDINKKVITNVATNNKRFTTPSNAYYIVLNIHIADDNVQLEQGDTATAYEPYKENNITFYINEPLRGTDTAKDKVYVKDDKVVVQRNCGSITLDGSDDESLVLSTTSYQNTLSANLKINDLFLTDTAKVIISNNFNCYSNSAWGVDRQQIHSNSQGRIGIKIRKCELQSLDINGFKQWLQQNPTTVVYQLAEPTYEEVEYNDVKLFIESFKNSTLFYNSNIPVTSAVHYSYSVPIVDTVAQTANVTDQQDSMIIDLATQVAVMEMMLM